MLLVKPDDTAISAATDAEVFPKCLLHPNDRPGLSRLLGLLGDDGVGWRLAAAQINWTRALAT